MPSPGRPRVLDLFKQTEIVEFVAAGGGIAGAARSVGCSVATVRREALRNEDFARDLRIAQREAEMQPLECIRKAAESQWRAAAWLLERTNPQQFDRRRVADAARTREVDDALEAAIQAALEEIVDPQLRLRVARRLIDAARRSPRVVRQSASATAPSSGFPHVDEDQRRLDLLLEQLDRNQTKTFRGLLQDFQNPPKCA